MKLKYAEGRVVAVVFCLAFNYSVLSQESIRPEISVIPPSPNAAAINKFVDVPVSYYTGTPNISIPLYTLKVEGMSLPISLDYHASGLKVEEHASNVGAGWRLNAGGVITRSVHGLPDEVYTAEGYNWGEQRGWFQSLFVTSPNTSDDLFENGELNFQYIYSCDMYLPSLDDGTTGRPVDPLDHLAGGNWDLEPDMYHLSYPGGSSKFIFEQNGDLFELVEDDIDFLKYPFTSHPTKRCSGCPPIQQSTDPTGTDYSFKILDKNGVAYTYSDVERTTATSGCFPNNPDINNGVSNRQSAWYLTKMEIGNRWIKFNYADEWLSYESDYYETKKVKVPGTSGTVDPSTNICMNDMAVSAKRPTSIETSNGYKVTFVASTSDRNDLDGSHRIEEVIISRNGIDVKHYDLIYDYFGNDDKLKLEEVRIVSGTEILNKYTLDYYSGIFPAPDSKSQDYWGYYNGASNASMIPEWKNDIYHVNYESTVDREPDLPNTLVGTLSKITYPTGGYTRFDYELNEFYNEDYPNTYNYVASASGGTETVPVEDYDYFTIDEECSATYIVTLPLGGLVGGAQLQKHNGSAYMPYTPSSTLGNRVILPVGDYRLYASSGSSEVYKAEIEFEKTATEKFNKAGGLRIRKMTFYDPVADKHEYRFYKYITSYGPAGKSSGKLFTDPRIAGYITTATEGDVDQQCTEDMGSLTTFANLSQVSQVPLGVSQGSSVGYGRVVTFKTNEGIEPIGGFSDEDKINGETVYTYTNDTHTNQQVYPPVPLEDLDYKNGKLLTKEDYRLNDSESLEKMLEEVNSYEDAFDEEEISHPFVTAYMFRKIANRTCYSCVTANTIYASYKIYRRWNRLRQKVEHTIENDTLTKTTDFFYKEYNNGWIHHETESMTTTTSEGTTDYIFDRNASFPGLMMGLMEEVNSEVIRSEKVTYSSNLPVTYSIWDGVNDPGSIGSHIMKQHITRNPDGSVQRVINNPQSTNYDDENATIYIHSYDTLGRVVAEITGISENELEALLTANSIGGIIDDIEDDTGFVTIKSKLNSIRQVLKPHHLMTTFLYNESTPWRGIHGPTHIIDPSGIEMKYKYDEYGRLQYVLDEDDNLVRKVSYNFKNND